MDELRCIDVLDEQGVREQRSEDHDLCFRPPDRVQPFHPDLFDAPFIHTVSAPRHLNAMEDRFMRWLTIALILALLGAAPFPVVELPSDVRPVLQRYSAERLDRPFIITK